MTFEEVYQQISKMHYEILDERESISKSARLSLSTWMLDILTEYRDEWRDDCKRFNKVIREALNREPSEDGTLEVKVEDATKVGRVLIIDDEHRGGLYYPDEDEPQGDLISRAEAIDALRYAQHRFTVADEAGGMGSVKWSENVIYFAAAERVLTELPSADKAQERPRGEWVEQEDDYHHYWECSECGMGVGLDDIRNFCPNCGAKMDGERSKE